MVYLSVRYFLENARCKYFPTSICPDRLASKSLDPRLPAFVCPCNQALSIFPRFPRHQCSTLGGSRIVTSQVLKPDSDRGFSYERDVQACIQLLSQFFRKPLRGDIAVHEFGGSTSYQAFRLRLLLLVLFSRVGGHGFSVLPSRSFLWQIVLLQCIGV